MYILFITVIRTPCTYMCDIFRYVIIMKYNSSSIQVYTLYYSYNSIINVSILIPHICVIIYYA